jgi:hypothetical protein
MIRIFEVRPSPLNRLLRFGNFREALLLLFKVAYYDSIIEISAVLLLDAGTKEDEFAIVYPRHCP